MWKRFERLIVFKSERILTMVLICVFFPILFQFTKFRISDPSTGTHLKFRLCDMRGLEETMDVKLEDIAFLLDGNLPNKYKV